MTTIFKTRFTYMCLSSKLAIARMINSFSEFSDLFVVHFAKERRGVWLYLILKEFNQIMF